MPLDTSLVGKPSEPTPFTYTWKDLSLYALGIGARKDELDFIYEGRGPKVIPSFAVVPMFGPMLARLKQTGCDLAMVVHGAQRVRVHAPFPNVGTLSTTATIRGIYDMRRFASVMLDMKTVDEKGTLLAENSSQIIVRDAGGFGGQTPPKEEKKNEIPREKEPDFKIEEKLPEEQALLYRLSGDLNPLHADPDFAAKVGFDRGPILHGLCTFGYMVRHAAKGAANGDATKVRAFNAQFRKPVWPGDTLVTSGWNLGGGKIALSVVVKERDEQVLTAAWAELA